MREAASSEALAWTAVALVAEAMADSAEAAEVETEGVETVGGGRMEMVVEEAEREARESRRCLLGGEEEKAR